MFGRPCHYKKLIWMQIHLNPPRSSSIVDMGFVKVFGIALHFSLSHFYKGPTEKKSLLARIGVGGQSRQGLARATVESGARRLWSGRHEARHGMGRRVASMVKRA